MDFVLDNLIELIAYAVAIAMIAIGARWVCVQFWRGWVAVDDWWISHTEKRANLLVVHPDPINGFLPIPRDAIPQIVDAVVAHVAQRTQTMMPVQPVPHTITYSPHTAYRGGTGSEPAMLPGPAAVVIEPHDLWQLYHADQLPDDGFLLGHNLDTGEPVTAGWMQLYSALVGGTAGSGKSTLIRSVLVQSALQGGRFVVLDRHYGAGEESLGASLQPLRGMMPFDVASTEAQMVDALRYVLDVGRRRLRGDSDRTPLVLVVDETTALFQRSNISGELTTVLSEIAQETRKAGVYALCIGHNFNGEVMPTTARNSFASFFSCRARRDVARVMSGNNRFAQAAEGLKRGQAVWLDTDGELVRLAVPNCTQRHVELVAKQCASTGVGNSMVPSFPHWIVAPDESADGIILEPSEPLDSRAARVIELFKSNHTQKEIIAEVWGAESGRRYMEASADFLNIVRDYLRRLEGNHA